MRSQVSAPRHVLAAAVLAMTLLLALAPVVEPVEAATRRPHLQLSAAPRVLTATLTGFRPRRVARVRLYIGTRQVLRRVKTTRRGRAEVTFRAAPKRPRTAVVTARVAGQRRRAALRYTSDGVWVAPQKKQTKPTSTTPPPLPPTITTPQGPFGPDPAFAPTDGIPVAVGHLNQALLDGQPEGTRFILAAGTHRLASRLRPRSGQQLVGMPGAVVDGSTPVTNFVNRDGVWASGGHASSYSTHGSCRSGYDVCGRSEAVFLDGQPLWQVAAVEQLAPGRFLFDRSTGELLLADDPTGRRVDLTVAPAAFVGRRKDGSLAAGVVVRNLVIRRFATMAQHGAVDTEGAAGWVVERNAIVQNSGAGVIADSDSVVRGNRINDNGQLGIGGHGANGLVEGNEIARNHTNGFSIGWEAGGSKWTHTTGLVIRGNYVHDNDGPGLWTDIENISTRYEDNVVERNSEAGIFHEISYDVVITRNHISGNGFGNPRWGYGAGIQIAGSPRATITDNIVDRNARGITLIQQNRGSGDYGPHEISDTTVSGNTVVMETGFTGLVQDVGDTTYFSTRNNRFANNTYFVSGAVSRPFEWRNGTKTVAEWSSFHPGDGPFSGL